LLFGIGILFRQITRRKCCFYGLASQFQIIGCRLHFQNDMLLDLPG
jgi:hypothetical protein